MTEEEWLICEDPIRMTEWVWKNGKYSGRRLRLYPAAYCRLHWLALDDHRSRQAVEVTEKYADGRAGRVDLDQASRSAREAALDQLESGEHSSWEPLLCAFAASPSVDDWYATLREADFPSTKEDFPARILGSRASHTRVARCIFGNPFRPVTFDARWRTADVADLARAIYDERAFDRLPVLADALMDAGCEDEQVIAHCRVHGPHARGCWVVDLALGKE